METITLADGTIIEEAHILALNETSIIIYIRNGMDIYTGFDLFRDADRVKTIKEDRYGEKTTYRGFKTIKSISQESDGQINIVMKK